MDKQNKHAVQEEPHIPLIDFPVEFPIKVMGKNSVEFRTVVLNAVDAHIPTKKRLRIDEKLSRNEHYLSYTIVAIFEDQESIDQVYRTLTSSPLVLMAL